MYISFYKKLNIFILHLCVVSILLCFPFDTCLAQKQLSIDWRTQAELALKREDYKAAEKILKKALKNRKQGKIPIWIELGKLKMEQQKWSDAKDWFSKVKKAEPENLLALYYIGLCQREIGKFHATLVRYLIWRDSEKKFKYVLRADSSFKDILYQFALLERLRGEYTEAISKALAQLKLKAYLEEVNVGLFFLYRSFLFHKPFENVREWLLQHPNQISRYFLGELHRQNRHFSTADSIYQVLVNEKLQMSGIPLLLALARLRISQKNPLEAETFYWQAIKSIQDSLDARFLFEDIKYVCNDEEILEYQSLNEVARWKEFFRKFWAKRDPLPAAMDNLRLIEHFKRTIYAEEYFKYDGFRSWIANPDKQEFLNFPKSFYLNKEYNDKGLIYIRHGEPDEKSTALAEENAFNESWLYKKRDGFPKMIFHFEIDQDGLAGDWRLTPMLQDSAAIDAISLWDGAYIRYLRGGETFRGQVANEIAMLSRENVSNAMSSDRHTWAEKVEPLLVDFSFANFRESKNRNLCELYIGFPVLDILEKNSADSTVMVNVGIAVQDMAWQEVSKRDQFIKISSTHPSIIMDEYVQSYQFKLSPEKYRFSFFVDPIDLPELGGLKMVVTLPHFSTDRLVSSDIQLAYKIEPQNKAEKLSKKNMVFLPNPSKKFKLNVPIQVYLEIYNLTKNESGRTAYTVSYKVEDAKKRKRGGFLGLFGRKKSISISLESERAGTSEIESEHIVLDVSELTPGKKKLQVRLQDINSTQTYETETFFWIE